MRDADPTAVATMLRAVVTALVDRPEDVEIRTPEEQSFEIAVNSADIPKVLGRNGQTVRAIRSVLSVIPEDRRSQFRISVNAK
jgi:predicted RNA-binding protein YlqC (UPF0109 family)